MAEVGKTSETPIGLSKTPEEDRQALSRAEWEKRLKDNKISERMFALAEKQKFPDLKKRPSGRVRKKARQQEVSPVVGESKKTEETVGKIVSEGGVSPEELRPAVGTGEVREEGVLRREEVTVSSEPVPSRGGPVTSIEVSKPLSEEEKKKEEDKKKKKRLEGLFLLMQEGKWDNIFFEDFEFLRREQVEFISGNGKKRFDQLRLERAKGRLREKNPANEDILILDEEARKNGEKLEEKPEMEPYIERLEQVRLDRAKNKYNELKTHPDIGPELTNEEILILHYNKAVDFKKNDPYYWNIAKELIRSGRKDLISQIKDRIKGLKRN